MQQNMKHTETSHPLKPLQTKTFVNFNSGDLHFYYVYKIGIDVFFTIYAPGHTILGGTLIQRQT
jgi:hypothetical protein